MRYARRPSRTALVVGLGVVTTFQATLAAGAPFGALAYGGGHPGVLPTSLRVASGVATVVWGAATVAVTAERPGSPRARRAFLTGLAGVASLGAVANLASPSLPERLVWVPVTVALAAAAWREARGADPEARPVTV